MMIKNVRFLVVAAALCAFTGVGVPALGEEGLPALDGLTAEAGPSGPVIHLRATGQLDTVHYSPQPGVWIVEMPEATWDQTSGMLTAPELGIERATLARVEEFGKRLSRLTVWLTMPSQLDLVEAPDGLHLVFVSFASANDDAQEDIVSEDVPVPVVAQSEPVEVEAPAAEPDLPAVESELPIAESVATSFEVAEPTPSQPDVSVANASSLLEVRPVDSGDGLVIELSGDGALVGDSFTLPSPDRLVVDFHGVINRVNRQLYQVNSPSASRVRVAQFKAVPVPITRLVVDLNGPVAHDVFSHDNGATVTVGSVPRSAVEATFPEAAYTSDADAGVGTISIVRSEPVVDEPEAMETETGLDSAIFEMPEEETEELLPVAVEAELPEPRNPWVAEPSQLIEQAPAGEVLAAPSGAEAFETTEVATQEQQFTGEPITLTLKDADIKDVLRTFSELTQLNIVLDPSVGGSVTVELRDVPWDQALDLILRINNLDYILENNVLRVAPISKLAAEKAAKAQFAAQQEQAEPLKTVLKPLSYTTATQVAALLVGDSYILSDRGSVTVDERTNTLIIRDVVDRVEGVLRLIESLDTPTPQVVIEGRIVETTRDFSRELGVSWGFMGTMNSAHGNDTGLNFPNSLEFGGGVDLPRGNPLIGFTFADILNTFNLDFTLSAAESEGTVKIVSTPRITTQNLQRASIRSGLQIPIQTVANNTVTVQYVDATLRLEVTPQITAEGTVNLDLDINKREPQLGLAIAGGNNAPIFTREAQTQLLVRDGGTTVIAGIYQINDQEDTDSVPGISKIPILGWLFKNKGVFNRHDELLIFVTPRIVKY